MKPTETTAGAGSGSVASAGAGRPLIESILVEDDFVKLPPPYQHLQSLLPSKTGLVREKITFIMNGHTAYANAIRRACISEVPVLILDTELGVGNLVRSKKTDPYLIESYIRDKLNMIPLTYDMEKTQTLLQSNPVMHISFENTSTELAYVTMAHLRLGTVDAPKSGPLPVQFHTGIRLTAIQPGHNIILDQIRLRLNTGGVSRPCYDVIFRPDDFDPFTNNFKPDVMANLNPYGFSGTYKCDRYHMGFRTCSLRAMSILKFCFDSIRGRVRNILSDLKLIKAGSDLTELNYVTMNAGSAVTEFMLANVDYTIAVMYPSVILEMVPTIKFVTYEKSHPGNNYISVKIDAVDAIVIMINASEKILNEFKMD